MKKMTVFLALLLMTGFTYAQDKTKDGYTKSEYLQKAKTQKTFGFLLLGGGVAMAVTGAALSGTFAEDTGKWLIIGGGVLAASSVPLFISSSKNTRKAESLTILASTQYVYCQNGITMRRQPAITLRLNL